MAIDRIRIEGVEFTRVAQRYLLETEVADTLSHVHDPSPHVQQLTTLLEDLVTAADAIALQVTESSGLGLLPSNGIPASASTRTVLGNVRDALREQLTVLEGYMHRLDA